ncbi:MAG: hypothetical protein FJZ59_02540 [Chlamydiae bacterium]|nr:hypothetical protein [Chlamydiota bacterium]
MEIVKAPTIACPFSLDYINSAASLQKTGDNSKVQKIVKYFLKNPGDCLSMLKSASGYSASLLTGIQNMVYKEIKHLSRAPREPLFAGAGAGAGSSEIDVKELEKESSQPYQEQIKRVAKIFKDSSFNGINSLKEDLVITCSDGSCVVSKRIFSMHNEYFRRMLSSRSRESAKIASDELCPLRHHVIDYREYSKDCIEALNRYFLGTLDVETLSLKTKMQLIELSDMIGEDALYDSLKIDLTRVSSRFNREHNVSAKIFVKKGEPTKCLVTPDQIGLCNNDMSASLGITPESDLGFFLSTLVNGVILQSDKDRDFIPDGIEFLSVSLQKRLRYVYLADDFISENLLKTDLIRTIGESGLEIGYYFAKKVTTECLKTISCEENNCYFESGLSIHFSDDAFSGETNPVELLKTLGYTFTRIDTLYANEYDHYNLVESITRVGDEVGHVYFSSYQVPQHVPPRPRRRFPDLPS